MKQLYESPLCLSSSFTDTLNFDTTVLAYWPAAAHRNHGNLLSPPLSSTSISSPLSPSLVIYTTSNLLRWRFSLSTHYGFTHTSIPYRYLSLSAEPIEAVSRGLNLSVEPSHRDRSGTTDTMSIEIVPLSRADIPGAVECVQKAFADDPYFRWAFDDPAKVRDVPHATHPRARGDRPEQRNDIVTCICR